MPKLSKVMGGGGGDQKYLLPMNCMSDCVLAQPLNTKVSQTKAGNRAKPLRYSGTKLYFVPILSRCSRSEPPTSTHSRQRCSWDWRVRSKMPSCCCLNDKGNKTLFRINISPPPITIAGLEVAGQWLGLQRHRTSHQWTSYEATFKTWFTRRQLILKRILLPILFRQQQPSISEHKSVFAGSLSAVYRGRWPYVGTSALNWYNIFFFQNTSVVLISNLNQTDFDRL